MLTIEQSTKDQLNEAGERLGRAFVPADAREFNRISNAQEVFDRFVRNMKTLMAARGLNQEKLAELTDLSPTTIDHVCNGRGSFQYVSRVCCVLEVRLGNMLLEEFQAAASDERAIA